MNALGMWADDSTSDSAQQQRGESAEEVADLSPNVEGATITHISSHLAVEHKCVGAKCTFIARTQDPNVKVTWAVGGRKKGKGATFVHGYSSVFGLIRPRTA